MSSGEYGVVDFLFLRLRRPPRSTRTDTLFPYTPHYRSQGGAQVAVMGRSLDRAQEGAAQIAALGVRVHAMSCDVRLPEAVAAAFDEAEEAVGPLRSGEHTSELQSLMSISYAVFCLKQKTLIHSNYHRPPRVTKDEY